MNVRMWEHAATQRNLATRGAGRTGCFVVGPDEGAMACGEFGPGRMAEVPEIVRRHSPRHCRRDRLRAGMCLVTSGPTHEPIDARVRYIANRSSGAAGHGTGPRRCAIWARG